MIDTNNHKNGEYLRRWSARPIVGRPLLTMQSVLRIRFTPILVLVVMWLNGDINMLIIAVVDMQQFRLLAAQKTNSPAWQIIAAFFQLIRFMYHFCSIETCWCCFNKLSVVGELQWNKWCKSIQLLCGFPKCTVQILSPCLNFQGVHLPASSSERIQLFKACRHECFSYGGWNLIELMMIKLQALLPFRAREGRVR